MIASASSRLRDAAFESSCAQSGLNALTGIPLKIVKTFVCIETRRESVALTRATFSARRAQDLAARALRIGASTDGQGIGNAVSSATA